MNRRIAIGFLVASILAIIAGLIIVLPYMFGGESAGKLNTLNVISGFIALVLAISFLASSLYYFKRERGNPK